MPEEDKYSAISNAAIRELSEQEGIDLSEGEETRDDLEADLLGDTAEAPEASAVEAADEEPKPKRGRPKKAEAPLEPEWTPPSKEDWERASERAGLVDMFEERFQRDPAGELSAWFRNLTPEQQNQYLWNIGALQPAAPPDPFEGLTDEDLTPADRFYRDNRDYLDQSRTRMEQQ